jgi:hypothetical protein
MSEMSQAQGPVGANVDADPTDDMVPPGARAPRDSDAERFGPEDVGPEDVVPQDTQQPPHPAGVPLPRTGDSGGEESAPPAGSSSDPMPDIAGTSAPDV